MSTGSTVSRDSEIITPALWVLAANSSNGSRLDFSRKETKFSWKTGFSNSERGRDTATLGKSHCKAPWDARVSSAVGDVSNASNMTSSLEIHLVRVNFESLLHLHLPSEINKKASVLLRDTQNNSTLKLQVTKDAHQRYSIHVSILIHKSRSL